MQRLLALVISLFAFQVAYASTTIQMYMVSADGQQGKPIGTITAEDAFGGVLLKPDLHDLPPGPHGFHIHENAACGDNGMAAGGHLDPAKTEQHNGPYNNNGHLGDMPVLVVNQDGTATLPTLAPRFKVADLSGHAFMIHVGGDNYSDTPTKLGGGGARMACGVVKG
jgi:Cu-Zn family superoxide dismutase